MTIKCYDEFCKAIKDCGFSMGGGNPDGIFAVIPWDWNEEPPYPTPVRWHTGDSETDPWEWRMRVLSERDDIAYAKCFFGKSGYISAEWYPYFLACRRGGTSFSEEYESGVVSWAAKKIYDLVKASGSLPLHELKRLGGFGKEDKTAFDKALVELQMKMFLTMCGRMQKRNMAGECYGWNSTVFCTVESFWQDRGRPAALAAVPTAESAAVIADQVMKLNPDASEKRINKFIFG